MINERKLLDIFDAAASFPALPPLSEHILAVVRAQHDEDMELLREAYRKNEALRRENSVLRRAFTGERRDSVLLSWREQEVYELVTKGFSNAVVAFELGITEKTVKFHLTHIYKKTETRTRSELIAKRLTATPGPIPCN